MKHSNTTVLDRVTCDRTSILARLMATENIVVEHMPDASTASFDPIARRLVLPVWQNMDTDVYDMLVGHEVGHALYTPCTGWHSPEVTAIDPNNTGVVKSYLNIVEDARIERLMKRRYPGLVHNFRRAYITLYNGNKFGTNGTDLRTLTLIDRLNLRAKVGLHVHAEVPLALDEEVWYTEMMTTETWDDVVDLTRRLYNHCRAKANGNSTNSNGNTFTNVNVPWSDDNMLSDNDDVSTVQTDPNANGNGNGGNTSVLDRNNSNANGNDNKNGGGTDSSNNGLPKSEPQDQSAPPSEPTTNVALGQSVQSLRSGNDTGITYISLPVNINWRKFIVDYRDVLADFADRPLQVTAYDAWRRSSINYINMLVKEFELRKAADVHARTSVSRSGVLDADRLHQYRYNDDIFRRLGTVKEGKSHGMVMFLDWSSSMSHVIDSTMRQVMTLAAFCRRMNIPFEVYAFSDYHANASTYDEGKDDDAVMGGFQLFNLLSSRMSTREFVQAMQVCVTLGKTAGNAHSRYRLNGTPLHQTMMAARYIVEDFQQRTRVQIVNSIFLTDGEDGSTIRKRGRCDGGYTVFRDMRTRTQVRVGTDDNCYGHQSTALLRMLASTTGSRVVGMYLTDSRGGKSRLASMAGVQPGSPQHDELVAHFRTHRFVEIKNQGYDSYFVIPSDKMDTDMNERDEFMAKQHKTRNGVARSFASTVAANKVNRVLLGRFVDLISR